MLVAPTRYVCFFCDRDVKLEDALMVPTTGKLACGECNEDLTLITIPVIA